MYEGISVLQVLNDLRANRAVIENSGSQQSYSILTEVADKYGYNLFGIASIDWLPSKLTAVVFGRRAEGYDVGKAENLADSLRSDGYGLSSIQLRIENRSLGCVVVKTKLYTGGGVGLLERQSGLEQTPYLIMGYDSTQAEDTAFVGLFLDTKPEDVSTVDEIVQVLKMEPRKKIEIPPAFRELFGELDADGI